MQNKRGQIYIISAIIIILIMVGLAGITNQATYSQAPSRFYELADQLAGENYVLYSYGLYNQKNPEEIINNFTQVAFKDYAEPTGAEFMAIYGNLSNVTYTKYQYEGGVSLSMGSARTQINKGELKINETKTWNPNPPGTTPTVKNITINFKGADYVITLRKKNNYWAIFTKTDGLDKLVSKSKD